MMPGALYDHILSDQLEQVTTLLQGVGVKSHMALVDLGCREVIAGDTSASPIFRQIVRSGSETSCYRR